MEQLLEDEWDEYDYCSECRRLGNDYIVNQNGELEFWCEYCSVNPDRFSDD